MKLGLARLVVVAVVGAAIAGVLVLTGGASGETDGGTPTPTTETLAPAAQAATDLAAGQTLTADNIIPHDVPDWFFRLGYAVPYASALGRAPQVTVIAGDLITSRMLGFPPETPDQ